MLQKTSTGSEREVLFRLRAVPDKTNPRAFKQLTDEAVKAQKAIDQAAIQGAQRTAREREKALSQQEKRELAYLIKRERDAKRRTQIEIREEQQAAKERERIRRDEEREADRLHTRHRQRQRAIAQENRRQREAEARERQREYDQEIKDAQWLAREEEKARKKVATERMRAERQAQQMAEKSAAAMAAGHERLIAGSRQAIEGVTKLGRAFALTGLVGEENMQKVLQALIKVQIAADAVRGGMDLYQGIRSIRAGRAAVGGALGRIAGNAAGGAAGGIGGAAVIGGGAGAGVAATASASLAAVLGVGAAGYSAFNFGKDVLHMFGYGGGAAHNGMYGRLGEFYGDTFTGIAGTTGFADIGSVGRGKDSGGRSWRPFSQAARFQARTNRMARDRMERLAMMDIAESQAEAEIEARRSQRALQDRFREEDIARQFADKPREANAARLQDARAALARDRSSRQSLEVPGDSFSPAKGTNAERMAARQDEIASLGRLLDLENERMDVEKEAARNRSQSIQETIAAYKAQADAHREAIKNEKNNYASLAKSFIEMTPMERAQLAATKDALSNGKEVAPERLAQFERFATDKEQEEINKRYIAKAEGMGSFGAFSKDYQRKIAEHKTQVDALAEVAADLQQENLDLKAAAKDLTGIQTDVIRALRKEFEQAIKEMQEEKARIDAEGRAREAYGKLS